MDALLPSPLENNIMSVSRCELPVASTFSGWNYLAFNGVCDICFLMYVYLYGFLFLFRTLTTVY